MVGAAGYAGGEVCRLLLGHPRVGAIIPISRSGVSFEQAHPNLRGSGLTFHSNESALAAGPDVVFFCTPTGEAMHGVSRFLDRGARAIDLSADFRFSDPHRYERTYGRSHDAIALLAEAACGITELNRDEIKRARLVANPGCYVITALLALFPLLGTEYPDLSAPIRISAINGTSGGGKEPRRELMHAETAGSMLPYSLDGHRHAPELECLLEHFGGRPAAVDLTTAHGPFVRGIFLTASVPVHAGQADRLGRDMLLDRYRECYGAGGEGEYFVRIVDVPRRGALNEKEYELYPRLADVVGSNFCHIGLDYDATHGLIRLVAVTDNLIKGAAGSAVQNMNVLAGLPESTGLAAYAL